MQRKEKILQILESTDNQIIDFMNKASKYRENNLITYSKNIFIPLTEICKNDCGYCNFKKTPDDPSAIILKTKEEVLASLKEAEKYGCSEALFTFGEDADEEESVQQKLAEFGYENIVDYVFDICKMNLEEKDWEELLLEIDLVSFNFTTRLVDRYDSLVDNDIRFCCLIKLGFKFSEIALILGCSVDAVYKKEKSILRRMDMEHKIKLKEILRNI